MYLLRTICASMAGITLFTTQEVLDAVSEHQNFREIRKTGLNKLQQYVFFSMFNAGKSILGTHFDDIFKNPEFARHAASLAIVPNEWSVEELENKFNDIISTDAAPDALQNRPSIEDAKIEDRYSQEFQQALNVCLRHEDYACVTCLSSFQHSLFQFVQSRIQTHHKMLPEEKEKSQAIFSKMLDHSYQSKRSAEIQINAINKGEGLGHWQLERWDLKAPPP